MTSSLDPDIAPRVRGRRRSGAASQGWDPRQAIFDTAERLCAARGIEAVSVRDIASEAGVSLAAMNYYFGSRTNLLVEILQTRLNELRALRAQLNEELAKQDNPGIRDVIRAFMLPLAQWRAADSPRRAALQFLCQALLSAEPGLRLILDQGLSRFSDMIALFRRALPGMSDEELFWRFNFTLVIEHMNLGDTARLVQFSGGLCNGNDSMETLERAVDFATAGFMAPVYRFPSQPSAPP